jgi:hypothetical protein
MEAPAKRAFTADVHDAILASNAPRHDFISDDLTARLQNVGSRVRRSVAEGYTTPAPSPLTQSPVKPHHTTPVAFIPTSNQILQSVFGSPTTRFGATFGMRSPSPSPSPRKRNREDERAREMKVDLDSMECCDSSSDADDLDSDSDDEVLITPHLAADGFPNVLAGPRPMRPLRRPRITQPVFGASISPAKVVAAVQPASEVAVDHLTHGLHHRVPLPVTVGGGDNFSSQV